MASVWSWVQTASGRVVLQNRQGRLGTKVAAQTALPNHQLKPLHRQRAGTEHCQAGAAGDDRPRPGSMAVQHLQHLQHLQLRRLVAVPIRVHCSAHGTRVLRQDKDSGGLPYPASDLGSRNPSSNPDSSPDSNLHRNLYPAPSSKSAPCGAGRGLAFVEGRSAMRFNLSIQAIGLIGQIEKIERIGIREKGSVLDIDI